ncbi:alginate O-acetyltransferase AlgX-related protein [Desulfogranum mediterraneum]|uniref:alginate O-acetyltransferase AlgX-related protein n=1 Tax=Desulfogranum mediterraneum TaxID=160661 RepID=UPI00042162A3|nr:hypothetical protein [Desulfogranum mediterraneum]
MNCPRTIRYGFIVLFLLALWTPLLVTLATPHQEVSISEKRRLAPPPSLKLAEISRFPRDFEAYYNDHFGLREPLVQGYNSFQFALLNTSTSKRVIVGRDGWLFQNGRDHVRDMRNLWPFSPGELQHWARVLSAKQAWLKERGIVYIFVLTPSKPLLYPEELPQAYQPVQPESRADQLIDYLRNHTQVPVVDMRRALARMKRRLRPYHKTDTHWNSYGAYIGYQQIIRELRKHLQDISSVSLKARDFKMSSEPGGDLARSLNLRQSVREEVPIPIDWQPSCLPSATLKGEHNDTNRNKQWFSTSCEGKHHRVVMFRDSYSLAMMPYLSESFRFISYIPHSPVRLANLQEISQQQAPDIVIEQRTSRWLRTPEG